jgi:uncharacterized membrane protein YccC
MLPRLAAQFTLDSALCRHAIRLGVAVAVALLLVPFVDKSNGAWMVTGALIVMKPAFGGTLKTARQRALGTVVGAAIAGAVAALTSEVWVLLALAFLATWLAESIIRLSFTLFAVFITPLSILLANVLIPGSWEVAWQRTVDVGVGAGIGIGVSILVLPRPVRASLPSMLRATAATVADFLEAVHAALRERGLDTHRSRAAAERSLSDLTITVSQLRDEPRAWRVGAIPAGEALRALRATVDDAASILLRRGPTDDDAWAVRVATVRAVSGAAVPRRARPSRREPIDADIARLVRAVGEIDGIGQRANRGLAVKRQSSLR